MRFKNLTPHVVDVFRMDGDTILVSFPPSSLGALRLAEEDRTVGKLDVDVCSGHEIHDWAPEENYWLGVPLVSRYMGATLDMPPVEPDTVYIVSLPVLMGLHATGTTNPAFIAPDTGSGPYGAVRDEKGNLRGVRRFLTLSGSAYQAPETVFPAGTSGPWSVAEWEAANPLPVKG